MTPTEEIMRKVFGMTKMTCDKTHHDAYHDEQ